MTTVERIIVKLIAGTHDYTDGVQSFDALIVNDDSLHRTLRFPSNFSYEKACQFKYFIALTQLTQLGGLCVFCGKLIISNHLVVLSHNFGHTTNFDSNGGGRISNHNIIEKHYMYSIIHAGCNAGHRARHDKFDSMKLAKDIRNMVLDIAPIYQHCVGVTYWFTVNAAFLEYVDNGLMRMFITAVAAKRSSINEFSNSDKFTKKDITKVALQR